MPHRQTLDEAARAFGRGASSSTAQPAGEGRRKAEDRHIEVSHARRGETPDKTAQAVSHQEDLLDEALEETFPSSDPISPKHVT